MNETNAVPNSDTDRNKPFSRRRSALGVAVGKRVKVLQDRSTKDDPSAVRLLAVLRKAVGTPPGSSPEAWADTIGLLPDDLLGVTDDPSPAELAVHHAMTLFALHRQGRVSSAHVDGSAPGSAFARLSRHRSNGGEDEGVRRRFDALVTAATPAEAAHHLRGLITLARSGEGVSIDYGMLADDLADLWTPWRRDRVRLRWARQYRGTDTVQSEDGDPDSDHTRTASTDKEQA